ncbi:hypothetical protein CI109_102076 [Kwoniella shandongensis]|uniref:Uncharacterized protein n=1 Tax=Kwoniella shandongensis TaxID=1734106 RepID=A0A5M6BQH9_9TREE|nr:uncharacterized protein CI109_006516 [Kwoniella shandongensis]KAA5525146.1 hypothetical protein CI109_006516 [Kwoniella shandongensis]
MSEVRPQPDLVVDNSYSSTSSDFGMDELEYDQELEEALHAAESSQSGTAAPAAPKVDVVVVDIEDLPLPGTPSRSRSDRNVEDGGEVTMEVEDDRDLEERLSLFQRFRKKGFLSVSDLVGPVWCETQPASSRRYPPSSIHTSYPIHLEAPNTDPALLAALAHPISRLRTLPFLPPSQRPSVIKSTAGKEISVDIVKVEGKEKILRRGETIHKRLEREIHPQEVVVTATTREDVWGLRFLNMLSAVEALLTLGKCREMPVVGFVNGIMVMGIIDEITRQPLSTTTPPKPETRSSRQTALTSFFSPTKARPEAPIRRERTHKLFISDSKTRASGTLPRDEDTLAGKLQVMMYKEMLDAILLSSTSLLPSSSQSVATSSILPSRIVFSWSKIFDHLKLDPSSPFSDEFVGQSRAIIVGNGLRCGADAARCLNDMTQVWDCYVQELGLGTSEQPLGVLKTAKSRSKGKEKEDTTTGRTEDLLELVYRRAGAVKKAKSANEGSTGRKKRRRRGTRGKKQETDGDNIEGEPPPGGPQLHESAVDINGQGVQDEEERLVRLAIAESLQSITTTTTAPRVDVDPESSSFIRSTAGEARDNSTPKRPSTRNSEREYWDKADRDSDDEKEEEELAWALEMSLEPMGGNVIGEGEEGEKVVIPTSSSQRSNQIDEPTTDKGSDASSESSSSPPPTRSSTLPDKKPGKSSGSIIGKTRFTHSPTLLAAHLESVLQFWMGEREPNGVSLEETRRCGWCEFEEGCEWRLKKAEEIWKNRKS